MSEDWSVVHKQKDFDVVYNNNEDEYTTQEFEDLVDYMVMKSEYFKGQAMSKDWVKDIADMHIKFGVNEVIRNLDSEKLKTFLKFRVDFLQEEIDELKAALTTTGFAPNEAQDEVVDALIDLCVVAIGTLNAFDVDPYKAWDAVHAANMAKNPGVNPNRPNPLGLPDMVKPAGWTAPHHYDNVGLLNKINWG